MNGYLSKMNLTPEIIAQLQKNPTLKEMIEKLSSIEQLTTTTA